MRLTRIHRSSFAAGLLAAATSSGLTSAANAAEPAAPAPPVPPAPVAPAPSNAPASPAASAQKSVEEPSKPGSPAAQDPKPADPRDQQIEQLKQVIDDLRRRVEELEKRPAPVAAPTPSETPAAPETPTPDRSGETGRAGATFLPNISAVGNIVFRAGDSKAIPNRGRFNFDEFELAIQDAVAPGLRYDVYLAAAKEEEWGVGLEEGYLTASRLAKGLTARLGRIRTPIGKFNPLHPHQWSTVTQPAVVTNFLGPEGLNSDGAVLEYLFPTKGFFLRGEIGRWETASEAEDGLGFGAGDQGAYSGRLWASKELGRNKELDLGFSRYQGRGDVDGFGRRRRALNAVDLTYRSYPGAYRRLLLATELFNHETSGVGDAGSRVGGFLLSAYRMNRFWEAGFRADYSKRPFPVEGADWGGSLFVTKHLTEQTSLRLEYQHLKTPEFGHTNGVFFQIFSGPGRTPTRFSSPPGSFGGKEMRFGQLGKLFALAVPALALALGGAAPAAAKVTVVTANQDLAWVTQAIGGNQVAVDYFAASNQDPHKIEPRPSQVARLARADLLVRIGMDLDLWLDSLLRAAANSKVQVGGRGYVDASRGIRPLEVPSGKLDPSKGDIHVFGNPHYMYAPGNIRTVAGNVLAGLKRVDAKNAAAYDANFNAFMGKVAAAAPGWKAKLAPHRGKQVVTYHKSLVYFLNEFGLKELDNVEPKPGLEPTPGHISRVASEMKSAGVKAILTEGYRPRRFADLLARQSGGKVVVLPGGIGAEKGQTDYFDFINALVDRVAAGLDG